MLWFILARNIGQSGQANLDTVWLPGIPPEADIAEVDKALRAAQWLGAETVL